jgi:hypothetical protein
MNRSPEPDILEHLRSAEHRRLEPSPSVRDRVMAAIQTEEPQPTFAWRGSAITALAASLAIAAIVGLSLRKPSPPPPPPTITPPRIVLPAFDIAALPVEIEQRVNQVYATEWAHIKGDLAALEGFLVARLPSGM